MQDQTVIVGDIGGTSVRFALVQLEDGKMRLSKTWKDTDPTISSFDEAFEHFVSFAGLFADASTTPDAAVFAIAGPIAAKGHVKLTNREWPEFHPESLMNRYGITDFRAVNDFTAMARGVAEDSLKRITSPIGLIPSCKTPDTLALSVLSEVVARYEGMRAAA